MRRTVARCPKDAIDSTWNSETIPTTDHSKPHTSQPQTSRPFGQASNLRRFEHERAFRRRQRFLA